MDKTQLQQKLSQPFDSGRWKEVVECVFPGSQYWAHERVIPSGEEIVEHFTDKGTIRLADGKNLALVELHLKKGAVNLPKNRVKLRSLVAGLIDQERAHGVIAVFEQGGKDYRLSFVAKEAVIEDGEFKTRETPAKRYTYLLGPGETCRTAAERLYALSQKQELRVDDITDAFNVEKLNKQFFKDYQAQYEKFCSFLAAPENGYRKTVFGLSAQADEKEAKPIRDFVKRLLGRLVFLQFLQKKGWMGCPADSTHWKHGDRHFLQSFFAGCSDPQHFHSAFLTPLFYDALNREKREHDLFDLTGTRIPYLNGGLFEDDLPATKAIDFPPDYFQGLLDCFGAYNFTIDENDPMDAEVGIDPEMLGHIFENLLEDNKDKGAYYTPKAIVHYMCQESLLQYLKTGLELSQPQMDANERESEGGAGSPSTPSQSAIDNQQSDFQCLDEWLRSPDKTVSDDRNNFVRKNARRIEELLDAVKICDPAIGSGAFPMGLLQEIYRCKLNLDFTLDPAEVKRGIIQNSIYGVDIEKGAVDIARLRFWLSLVVDEETPSPLPNLDYKIMQGNSLLESFEGVELKFEWKHFRMRVLGGEKSVEKNLFGEIIDPQMKMLDVMFTNTTGNLDIEKIERDYFDEHDAQKKEAIRKQVDDFEKNFIRGELDKQEQEIRRQAKRLSGKAVETRSGDNKLSARDEKKLQALETELTRLKAAKEKLAAIQPGEKPYFLWQLYFMDVFKNGGFDIVIGNPPYLFARDSKKKGITAADKKIYYANYELAEYQVNLYPLFIERGTELLKTDGCFAFITPNNWLTINTNRLLRKFVLGQSDVYIVNFYARVFESASVDSSIIIYQKSTRNRLVRLFEYTERFKFIKEADSDYFLIQRDHIINIDAFKGGGVSELILKIESQSDRLASIADVKAGLKAYEVGKGNPPQTQEMKAQRVYHSPRQSSRSHIKYLDGKDVCRYRLSWSGEFLKFGDNLAAPRKDFGLYSTKRILVRQIPAKPPYCIHACLVEETCLNDLNSINVVNFKEPPEAVLGILNSRLVSFWFIHKFGKMQRETFPQFKVNELADFPLPKRRNEKTDQIQNLTNQIMGEKAKIPDADTSVLESKIDELVYSLYGLTPDEIKQVQQDHSL